MSIGSITKDNNLLSDKKCLSVFLFLIFFILILSSPSFAVLKTSAGTGLWNTAGTWSPSGVPAAGDRVVIQSGHTVTFDRNDSSTTCTGITVETGGTLTLQSGTIKLINAGQLYVQSGATVNIPSGATLQNSYYGSSDSARVKNYIYGTMNIESGGTFLYSGNYADIDIYGKAILTTDSVFEFSGNRVSVFIRDGGTFEATGSAPMTTTTLSQNVSPLDYEIQVSRTSGFGVGDVIAITDTNASTTVTPEGFRVFGVNPFSSTLSIETEARYQHSSGAEVAKLATVLVSNAEATDTTIYVSNLGGIVAGDEIAITPTPTSVANINTDYSKFDYKTVSSVNGTNQSITLTSGLTYGHSREAYVIKTNRDCNIRATSTTYGFFIDSGGDFRLENVEVDSIGYNIASSPGIMFDGADGTNSMIKRCSIHDHAKGMIIKNANSENYLINANCIFHGKSDSIYLSGATNNTFTNNFLMNTTTYGGRGVNDNSSNGNYYGSNYIIGNYGYGMTITSGISGSTATVYNNLVMLNNASYGMWMNGIMGHLDFDKNIIMFNDSHGLSLSNDTTSNITNCNIISNGSYGLLHASSSTNNVINTIVADNGSYELYRSSGTLNLSYSNIIGSTSGTINYGSGNISEDPLFVDPVLDHHSTSYSPNINSGDPSTPRNAIYGNADIGAYEYLGPVPNTTAVSVTSGLWSESSTWSPEDPTSVFTVLIQEGHKVTFDRDDSSSTCKNLIIGNGATLELQAGDIKFILSKELLISPEGTLKILNGAEFDFPATTTNNVYGDLIIDQGGNAVLSSTTINVYGNMTVSGGGKGTVNNSTIDIYGKVKLEPGSTLECATSPAFYNVRGTLEAIGSDPNTSTSLTESVSPLDIELTVNSVSGLGIGDIVSVTDSNASTSVPPEVFRIYGINTGTKTLSIETESRYSHSSGAEVNKLAAVLAQSASAGETTLYLSNIGELVAGDSVRIAVTPYPGILDSEEDMTEAKTIFSVNSGNNSIVLDSALSYSHSAEAYIIKTNRDTQIRSLVASNSRGITVYYGGTLILKNAELDKVGSSGTYGLSLTGSGANSIINNCSIHGSAYYGIYFNGGNQDYLINSNVIFNNTYDGISVNGGTQNYFIGNFIFNNGSSNSGIYDNYSYGNYYASNYIFEHYGSGINIQNFSGPTISTQILNNHLFINKSGGLYIFLEWFDGGEEGEEGEGGGGEPSTFIVDRNLAYFNAYGLYIGGVNATITSNTLVNNTTYGLYNDAYSGSNTLKNSIVKDGTYSIYTVDNLNVSYSNYSGAVSGPITWGTGNTSTDAIFVDPLLDYHLSSNSPNINAGDPTITRNTAYGTADVGALEYIGSGGIVEGGGAVETPSVTSISPVSGHYNSSNNITIEGSDFTEVTAVKIGGIDVSSYSVISSSIIEATIQSGLSLGTHHITVTNSGGTSTQTSADEYTVTTPYPAPTISSIDPDTGPTPGKQSVTITGTNFLDGATVLVGSNPATNVAFISSTKLTAVTSQGSGTVNVVVTNPDTQAATLEASYTYSDYDSNYYIETVVGSGGDTVSTTSTEVSLTIPAGALGDDTTISFYKNNSLTPGTTISVGSRTKKMLYNYIFGPHGTAFSNPATITMTYTDQQLAELNITEDTLDIYRFNNATGIWEALGATLDTENKTVSASIDHFSDYGLGGESCTYVYLTNEVITTDTIWYASDCTYYITGYVKVQSGTLTIEAGTNVRFQSNSGYLQATSTGNIHAAGEEGNRITITNIPGVTGTIIENDTSGTMTFDYCDISDLSQIYGESSGTTNISYSTIQDNTSYGIYLHSGTVNISYTTFTNNPNGIFNFYTGTINLDYCTIEGSTTYAYSKDINYSPGFTVTNTNFINNAKIAYGRPDDITRIISWDNNNTFSGNTNKELEIQSGSLVSDSNWPYRFDSSEPIQYVMKGNVDINSGTLTISPEVNVELSGSYYLRANGGNIYASGEADKRITFTRTGDNFNYIANSGAGTVTLTYVNINNASNGIYTTAGTTNLLYCSIESCSVYGIYNHSGTINVSHSNFKNNPTGVYNYFTGTINLDHCTIEGSSTYGYFNEPNYAPSLTISNTDFINNTTIAKARPDHITKIIEWDNNNTFSENDNKYLEMSAGNFSGERNWPYRFDSGEPIVYRLVGTPNFTSGTLTISPEVTIELGSGVDLYSSGSGNFYASGEADKRITFTRITGTSNYWGYVGNTGSGTATLTYADIRYANEGIYNSTGTTNVLFCSSSNNSNYGINPYSGTTNVYYSSFESNANSGLYCHSGTINVNDSAFTDNPYGIYNYYNGTVNLDRCTIEGSTTYGYYNYTSYSPNFTVTDTDFLNNTNIAYARPDDITRIINWDNNNTFSGNTNKVLESQSGAIASDGTWPYRFDSGTPIKYILKGNVNVSAGTLTISPEVNVEFEGSYSLYANGSGSIYASGEADKRITFTRLGGSNFDNVGNQGSGTVTLTYVNISKATNGIYTTAGTTNLLYCSIESCSSNGLYNHSGTINVSHSYFRNNPTGIYNYYTGTINIDYCTIEGSTTGYHNYYNYAPSLSITNTDFISNTTIAIARPDHITKIIEWDNNNIFSGNTNKYLEMSGGNFSGERNWPYREDSGEHIKYRVAGNMTISSGTLTISPEVTVEVSGNYYIIATGTGNIYASGEADKRITFTPAPGTSYWQVLGHESSGTVTLSYCDIENAGNYYANVYLTGSGGTLNCYRTTIKNSNGYGVYFNGTGGSTANIANCNILNSNTQGIYSIGSTMNIDIKNTIIYGSGNYGVYKNGSNTYSLTYNDAYNNSSGDYYNVSAGTGSLTDDPKFVDPGNSDFRLQDVSPCIDAGDPTSPLDPNGTTADIGVYYSGFGTTPEIDSIDPVMAAPGVTLSIFGTSFGIIQGNSTVKFGETEAADYLSWSSTTIEVEVPIIDPGDYDVRVYLAEATSNAKQFSVFGGVPPTIEAVDPSTGPISGGTFITITGYNLSSEVLSITFGGVPATDITFESTNKIYCNSPAYQTVEAVDVVVTNADYQHSGSSGAGLFTYTPEAPIITSVDPLTGEVGDQVTITGNYFGASQGTTEVKFGAITASSIISWANTEIVAVVPASAVTAEVTVTRLGLTSNTDKIFTVTLLAPTVISVDPSSGPTVGGAIVTISGTHFKDEPTVTFGTNDSPQVTFISSTTLEAMVPTAESAGYVDLKVTNPSEQYDTLSDGYQYKSPSWDNAVSWDDFNAVSIDNSAGGALTNYQIKVVVVHEIGMQDDFDDIRFTETIDGSALSYWKQSYTEGGSAIFWVKVPSISASSTKTIYCYFGNEVATDEGNGDNTFVFFDDFAGTTIDTGKWVETDTSGKISQNDKLIFSGGANNWTGTGLYTVSNFNRADSLQIQLHYKPISGSYNMVGWKDTTATVNYTSLVYGYFDYSNNVYVYEDGADRGYKSDSWVDGNNYVVKMPLKTSSGALYQKSSDGGNNFTTSYDSSYSSEDPLKVGMTSYNSAFDINYLFVRKYTDPEPSATIETGPIVASVDPDTGSTSGGTSVTISGFRFEDGATVTFGGVPATSVNFVDENTITCQSPAFNTVEVVDVTVTNPSTQTGTKTQAFTYTVTTSWYNASWNYRDKITIDHTKVEATLTNFPFLVNISSSGGLASFAQSDGDDILFTLSDGTTKLNHEIETFTTESGQLVAWVNIPYLSTNIDTTIYMYFGNSSCSNQQSVNNTWDSNYLLVQHLNETSGDQNDSTSNGNDGTAYGSIHGASGQINGADTFNSVASTDRLEMDNVLLAGTGDFTISAWIHSTNVSDTDYIAGNYGTGGYTGGMEFYVYGGKIGCYLAGGLNGNTTLSNNTWYYATVTRNSGTVALYLDGDYDGSASLSGSISGSNFSIGNGVNYTTEKFEGEIDEVKVSNIARSADWIKTEYNNQYSPNTFYTIAEAQPMPLTEDPVITSIDPLTGEVGDNVTIAGNYFDSSQGTSEVKFGTVTATSIISWSNSEIVAVVPATAVTAEVTVTRSGLISNTDKIFTVAPTSPTISDINPSSGSTVGGTIVTINGSNFKDGASVTFGVTESPQTTFISSLILEAMVPTVESAGYVDVKVTNPSELYDTLTNGFQYKNPSWDNAASWDNFSSVRIDNSTGGALTDYQIRVVVTYEAGMQGDFDDIRFTETIGGSALNYWIDTYTASDEAVFWIKIPSISASSIKTIYAYYGNSVATSESNGDDTFIFFDDASGTTITDKWDTTDAYGSFSYSGGYLVASDPGGSNAMIGIQSSYTIPNDVIFEADSLNATAGTSYIGLSTRWSDKDNHFSLYSLTNGNHNIYDFSGGDYSNVSSFSIQVDTWYDVKAISQGSDHAWYVTDMDIPIVTRNDSSHISGLVGLYTYRGQTKWDNLRARKYADPEPNVIVETGPIVSSVNPNSGSSSGGTSVTISGYKFQDNATVTFGGVPATSVSFVDENTITCQSPAYNTEEAVDVTVINPDEKFGTKTQAFTYLIIAPWYNDLWSHREKITIDHTKVEDDLTDFILLINLPSQESLATYAQTDGDDILFTLADGTTKLNHEIETFTSESGTLVAWVNIPNLYKDVDTKIYMYYGNAYSSNQQSVNATWNSDYIMVHHFAETSGTHYDSTANGHNGTLGGGLDQDANGLINGADIYNGTNSYINIPNSDDFDLGSADFTIKTWVNFASTATEQLIMQRWKSGGGTRRMIQLRYNADVLTFYAQYSTYLLNISRSWTPTVGTWYQISVTRTGNTFSLYVDGEILGASPTWYHPVNNSGDPIVIGSYDKTSRFFNGTIDEIYLSNNAKSTEWIKTEYNNQYSGSFLSAAEFEEQEPPPPPTIEAVVPNNGSDSGGTFITITGYNFSSEVSSVTFGGIPATNITYESSYTIYCNSPAYQTAEVVDVVVTNPNTQYGTKTLAFTYTATSTFPAPTVSSVDPNGGPTIGNNSITINGTNFLDGASVNIGASPATSIVFISSTQLTAVTPAGSGTVNVEVINPDTQAATLESSFTYQDYDVNYYVEDSVGSGGDTLNTPSAEATLTIPAGALTGDTTIEMYRDPAFSAGQSITVGSGNKKMLFNYICNPHGTTFATPVTLTMTYTMQELADQGINENTLDIFSFNNDTGSWEALGATLDTENKTVSVDLSHFSDYGLGGEGCTYVYLTNETISTDTIWYASNCTYYIDGYVRVTSGTLTIEPGTNVRFLTNSDYLQAYNSGNIHAAGEDGNRITITNIPGVTGTEVQNTGSGTLTLDYTDISDLNRIYILGSGTTNIFQSTIQNNTSYGLYVQQGTVDFSYSTLTGNTRGIHNYYQGNVTIDNCTIESSTDYAYYHQTGTFAGITNSSINNNGNIFYVPAGYVDDFVNFDNNNTFSGNSTNYFEISGGSVSSNSTWPYRLQDDEPIIYRTLNNVSVTSGTLTISPEVTIEVNHASYSLLASGGNIYASGEADKRITFRDSPATSYFGGIQNTGSGTVTLTYVDVESPSRIYMQGTGSINISHSTIQDANSAGLYAQQGTFNASNVTISNCPNGVHNYYYGIINLENCTIEGSTYGYYDHSSNSANTNTTMNNVLFSNNTNIAYVYPRHIDDLLDAENNNVFSNTTSNTLEIYGGTISSDMTWPIRYNSGAQIIYRIMTNNVNISAGTLTISPEAIIEFNHINYNLIANGGNIYASGEADKRITFTPSPATANCGGIQNMGAGTVTLTYVDVESPNRVYMQGSGSINISHSTIQDANDSGLYAHTGTINASDTYFLNNSDAVEFYHLGNIILNNCTIEGSANYALKAISGGSIPTISTNNILLLNNENIAYVYPSHVDELVNFDNSIVYSGNTNSILEIYGGSITSDMTWPVFYNSDEQIIYHAKGNISVNSGTLTISPEVTVEVTGNYYFRANGGNIYASGEADKRITITRTGGNFQYIGNSGAGDLTLSYCDVINGGGTASIDIDGINATLNCYRTTIRNGSGHGIYLHATNVTMNMTNCNILNNSNDGIYFYYYTMNINIKNSIIYGNGANGIRKNGSETYTLSHNDVYNNNPNYSVGISPGTGSISGDPLFVDEVNFDFNLDTGSPCIDAGSPEGVDIGVYESDAQAAPTVSSVTPTSGYYNTTNDITIEGTDFSGATAVEIGAVNVASFNIVSSTIIEATIQSSLAIGTYDIYVTNGAGKSAQTVNDQYTVTTPYSPPTVTSLDPNQGPTLGKNSITIIGTNFLDGASVYIGASPATDVVFLSSTKLTVVTPAGSGTENVSVINPDTQAGTLESSFTYLAYDTDYYVEETVGAGGDTLDTPSTEATLIIPAGALTGDTTIEMYKDPASTPGANFALGSDSKKMLYGYICNPHGTTFTTPVTLVLRYTFEELQELRVLETGLDIMYFNNNTGTWETLGATQDLENNTLTVTLTHFSGYVVGGDPAPTPEVTSCDPPWGSLEGGQLITINGNYFQDNATVTFGGIPSPYVTTETENIIKAETPAYLTEEAVNVTVTNPIGYDDSGTSGDNAFTYTASGSPSVVSVTPNAGSTYGYMWVTIIGSNFKDGTTVQFGSPESGGYVSASPVTVESSWKLTTRTPQYTTTEVVNVIVTNTPTTDSGTTGFGKFTYIPTDETHVSGIIDGPRTWAPHMGTIVLDGDIIITSTGILTIEPGTQVRVNARMIVEESIIDIDDAVIEGGPLEIRSSEATITDTIFNPDPDQPAIILVDTQGSIEGSTFNAPPGTNAPAIVVSGESCVFVDDTDINDFDVGISYDNPNSCGSVTNTDFCLAADSDIFLGPIGGIFPLIDSFAVDNNTTCHPATFGLAGGDFPEATLPGDIDNEPVTYNVYDSLSVPPSTPVSIEPQAQFKIHGICIGIFVYGTLHCSGEVDNRISIASYVPGNAWKGIRFINSPNSRLSYTDIEDTGCDPDQLGAVFISGGDPIYMYRNSIYSSLTGGKGIVISGEATTVEVHHNDLVNLDGTGILVKDGATVLVKSSIVYNNAGNGIEKEGAGGSVTITWTNIYNNSGTDLVNCSTGEGCTSDDPIFIAEGERTFRGDFQLQGTSPMIDTADPTEPYEADGTYADKGVYPYLQYVVFNRGSVVINPYTNKVYGARVDEHDVAIYDPITRTMVGYIDTGLAPNAIAINLLSNKIYTANTTSNNVTIINGSNNTKIMDLAVGTQPLALAVNPVTNKVFVANYQSNNMSVIDDSNAVEDTVAVGYRPRAVAVNPITNRIYTADYLGGTVTRINGTNYSDKATITVEANPIAIAVHPVSNKVYVACNGTGKIYVINGGTDAIITNITVGNNPRGLALDSNANKLYVTNYDSNTISVINTTDNSVIDTISANANEPQSIAADESTARIFTVNDGSKQLLDVNGSTYSTEAIAAGTSPEAVGVNQIINKIYTENSVGDGITEIDGTIFTVGNVGNYQTSSTIKEQTNSSADIRFLLSLKKPGPNSIKPKATGAGPFDTISDPTHNKFYVTNFLNGTVSIIDADTEQVEKDLETGINPYRMAIDLTRNRLYVTNYNSNTISIIDTENQTVLSSVEVGTGPYGVTVSEDTGWVYVMNWGDGFGGTVTIINASGEVLANPPVGQGPLFAAVNTNSGRVYVTNSEGKSISIFSHNKTTPEATISVGSILYDIIYNPNNNKVYAACLGSNKLAVLDENNILSFINGLGTGPYLLALNLKTNKIYASNWYGSSVSRIDVDNSHDVKTISTGAYPAKVTVNPRTNRIYVANWGNSEGDTVSVIAGFDDTFEETLSVGNGTYGINCNPNTGKIMAPAYNDSGVKTIVEEIEVAQGLTVEVNAFPENRTYSPAPKFTGTAATNRTDVGIQRIYYQLDTMTDAWTAADIIAGAGTTNISSYEIEIPNSLTYGKHTMYIYCLDSASSTLYSNGNSVGSNYVGKVKAYTFFVNSGLGQAWAKIQPILTAVPEVSAMIGKTLNYPNPYKPSLGNTYISYTLNGEGAVRIYIYDMLARLIWARYFVAGTNGGKMGYNEIAWNGMSDFGYRVGNGLYPYMVLYKGKLLGRGSIAVFE